MTKKEKLFFHKFTTQKKIRLLREDLKLRSFDLPTLLIEGSVRGSAIAGAFDREI